MKRDLLPQSDAAIALVPTLHVSHRWRYALPLVALALLWILAWYASTGRTMVETWARSQTFTHGFIVVPIVLWLVWRKREELASMSPAPAWWALAGLALAGGAWLMGELAAVNAVSQFALTSILVFAVIALLGAAVARVLAFPLAFLFFAVPVGEFITPQLMTWTADFVVAALRLSGIPVYREGLLFVIPSGSWSVVEACSGLRYLVASLMVGTLFAYLTYRSLTRRLIFVACAFLVPIAANWLRAYLIVMLGHLTDNQLAAGVDHLIYGWIFFGVVIGAMLWVGSRWREDDVAVERPVRTTLAGQGASGSRNTSHVLPGAALVALLAIAWKIGYWSIEANNTSAEPNLPPIAAAGEWRSVPDPITQWRPEFKDPSARFHASFGDGQREVGMHVVYYRNQNQDRKLVSSENVLERSEDFTWATVAASKREVAFEGGPLAVRAAELRGMDGQRLLVWQWYWINGRITSSDHVAKAYTALARLQGAGDDSAAVVIYTPKDVVGGPEAALTDFARSAWHATEAALVQTRNAR
jgi:exosortase A